MDNIASAKFMTKLDLLKGCWQVHLTERFSEISAFVTPDSFLQYTVMAFGCVTHPQCSSGLFETVNRDISGTTGGPRPGPAP